MKIKAKITSSDYIGLMFLLTYRKPAAIVITTGGLVSVGFLVAWYLGKHTEGDKPQLFLIAFAVATLIVLPFFVYRMARKAYDASALLQETIEYEFSDKFVALTGQSFAVEKDWEMLPKVEEIGKWFFIYESDKMANLIPFKCMTDEELKQLRAFFHSLQGVDVKGVK